MRCFIDMDGVLADYDREVRERNERIALHQGEPITLDSAARIPGIFLGLKPIEGAIEAVPQIMAMGFDVYIASKPEFTCPESYAAKATWVAEHLPALRKRIILTQDKGLLGGPGDFLVDDRPHKANVTAFPGWIIHFGGELPATLARAERITWIPNWTHALNALKFLRG